MEDGDVVKRERMIHNREDGRENDCEEATESEDEGEGERAADVDAADGRGALARVRAASLGPASASTDVASGLARSSFALPLRLAAPSFAYGFARAAFAAFCVRAAPCFCAGAGGDATRDAGSGDSGDSGAGDGDGVRKMVPGGAVEWVGRVYAGAMYAGWVYAGG